MIAWPVRPSSCLSPLLPLSSRPPSCPVLSGSHECLACHSRHSHQHDCRGYESWAWVPASKLPATSCDVQQAQHAAAERTALPAQTITQHGDDQRASSSVASTSCNALRHHPPRLQVTRRSRGHASVQATPPHRLARSAPLHQLQPSRPRQTPVQGTRSVSVSARDDVIKDEVQGFGVD